MLLSIVGFVVFMGLFEPAVVLVTPGNFVATYYGTNSYYGNSITGGVVNQTGANFTHYLVIPLISNANNSTAVYSPANFIASGQGSGILGGLSFMITGMSFFWKSMLNFPFMLWNILSYSIGAAGSNLYLPYAALAITALLAIGIMGYVSVLLVLKVFQFILKAGQIEEA